MRAPFTLFTGMFLFAFTMPPTLLPAKQEGKEFAKPGEFLPDDDREIFKQIREAYKATYEVPEDVLKDLRRQAQGPSEKREASILRDIRRLYVLSAEREAAILRELRRYYEQPTPEQERRIFREIDRGQRLPEGAVHPDVQVEHAGKVFRKFDANQDGRLRPEELSGTLRDEFGRWDANRDGSVTPEEFLAFYQVRLRHLGEQVVSGKLELGLKRGNPVFIRQVAPEDAARRNTGRGPKLPPGLPGWFQQIDTDQDGQLALYEWRSVGKALSDFAAMDRNDDGLLTPEEVLRYVVQNGEGSFTAAAERYRAVLDERKKKQ